MTVSYVGLVQVDGGDIMFPSALLFTENDIGVLARDSFLENALGMLRDRFRGKERPSTRNDGIHRLRNTRDSPLEYTCP